MNRRSLFFIVLSLVASISLSAQSDWEYVNDEFFFGDVKSSCIVGEKIFFLTKNNLIYSRDQQGRVVNSCLSYGTNNYSPGGVSWRQRIAFADELNGYIVNGENGEFRTEDGGETWRKVSSNPNGFYIVSFATEKVGWKLGWKKLVKTTDGGKTWVEQSYPGDVILSPVKLFALDTNRIFLIKSYFPKNGFGGIFFSEDGGMSWGKVEMEIPESSRSICDMKDILIKKSGKGVALLYAEEDLCYILMTKDYGKTWEIEREYNRPLEYIISQKDREWIFIGSAAAESLSELYIYKTINDGHNWFEEVLESSKGMLESFTFDPEQGIMFIKKFDRLLFLSNNGKDFRKIAPKNRYGYHNFCIDHNPKQSNKQKVICYPTDSNVLRDVNSGGNIEYLISFDSGETWQKEIAVEGIGKFIKDFRISEDILYVSKGKNHLEKSTDEGMSWEKIVTETPLPTFYDFQVGSNGRLLIDNLISLDEGNTWETLVTNKRCIFNRYFLADDDQLWSCGVYYDTDHPRGFVYKSEDNGKNWRADDLPTIISDLEIVDDSVTYALSYKSLYKTCDSGESWKLIKEFQHYYYDDPQMAFIDSKNGMMFCEDNLYKTCDGGNTWEEKEMKIIPSNVTKFEATKNGRYFIATWNGVITFVDKDYQPKKNGSIGKEGSSGKEATLYQNSPNPFNPSTRIFFSLGTEGMVNLSIYNILGERVATIVNEKLSVGDHQFNFDGSNLSSGVYLSVLKFNGKSEIRKMSLVK